MPSKFELAVDIVQFAIDLAGIVDPTGAADGISGLISLGRGKWIDAGISAISLIPYIGDAAKVAKIPKYAEAVATAIKLAMKDLEFARTLKPALERLKLALDKMPVPSLPAEMQHHIVKIRKEIDEFLKRRMYNPNPKHEAGGVIGLKGSKLDLSPDEAFQLLNDSSKCFTVPGKKQLIAVHNKKIYAFQPDGVGGYHAYPISGKEVAKNYTAAAPDVQRMLGIDFKRLSRME
jgi:hypothetical protein